VPVDDGARTGRRPAIAESVVATGKGDDGTTGLLFGGRVAKDDPRTEAYGTIDEAVAALGVARAELTSAGREAGRETVLVGLADVVMELQRDLFVAAAALATNPDATGRGRDGVTRVTEAMLLRVEERLAAQESRIVMPREFTLPGETRASAALELARTILRRAERRAVTLHRDGRLEGPWLLPWLNRAADLLWVLARAAEQAEGHAAAPARLPGAVPAEPPSR
jgi:cob(I)alamin adenosyltransferase